MVCNSVASNISETIQAISSDYMKVSDDLYSPELFTEYRMKVLEALNFDILISTPYSYYVLGRELFPSDQDWGLVKGLMLFLSTSDLKFELLPFRIFLLATELALISLGSDKVSEFARENYGAVVKQLSTFAKYDDYVKYFDYLSPQYDFASVDQSLRRNA